MGIVGQLVSYVIYKGCQKLGVPLWLSVFLSATIGDLMTINICNDMGHWDKEHLSQ